MVPATVLGVALEVASTSFQSTHKIPVPILANSLPCPMVNTATLPAAPAAPQAIKHTLSVLVEDEAG
ncbi:MAG: hypothetical protein RLZZ597_3339, partial [Cyanobacteriota bacterium]